MIEIKDLLGRFSKILGTEDAKIESIRSIIGGAIGIEIKREEIKIKNNVIYLNIKPIYKNEILLKKSKISVQLEERFGKRAPGLR